MRLISANALKSEMVTDLANTMRMQEMHKGDMAVRVLNKIDEAPTIDAIPVVRCKDCRWYDSAFSACDKFSYCVTEDFYCAKGEREA